MGNVIYHLGLVTIEVPHPIDESTQIALHRHATRKGDHGGSVATRLYGQVAYKATVRRIDGATTDASPADGSRPAG